MSRENVELVRALQVSPDVDLVTFFGDEESWSATQETLGPLFDERFEVHFIGVGDDDRAYRGLEGLREVWKDWLEPWESYRAEIFDLIDGGDRVLVLTDDYGRRRDTSADVRLLGAAIWTVDAGKVKRADFYADRDRALQEIDRSA